MSRAAESARHPEPRVSRLARFILESRKLSAGVVNHRAFLPPPDLELSTFNIDSLADEGVWRIGEDVRRESGRADLLGRADFLASAAYDTGLIPLRDDRPPRHVVIVGWRPDKADQKIKAQRLAASAVYVPKE
jgi:hypothetical protein